MNTTLLVITLLVILVALVAIGFVRRANGQLRLKCTHLIAVRDIALSENTRLKGLQARRIDRVMWMLAKARSDRSPSGFTAVAGFVVELDEVVALALASASNESDRDAIIEVVAEHCARRIAAITPPVAAAEEGKAP